MIRGLDFETFGDLDIRKVGLHNYVNHVSFRPLIAAIAQWDDVQQTITPIRFDFITDRHLGEAEFRLMVLKSTRASHLVAHNASFERAVLNRMGAEVQWSKVRDSAMVSRAVGASSKLALAAVQLLDTSKLDSGERLIKKFCQPQNNGYVYVDHVDQWTPEDWADWDEFGKYCERDAQLTLQIHHEYGDQFNLFELRNELVTHQMNSAGWYVDLDLVKRMDQQYQKNLAEVLAEFRRELDPKGELNFRSHPQLQKWCKERGIAAKSFDKLNLEKMIVRLEKQLYKLRQLAPGDKRREKIEPYTEVLRMFHMKQELGGSSLSKLEVIQRLVSPDGRLRHQYMHIGAGQTWRTSGRGVQMQNLVRLPEVPGDVSDLSLWSNEDLQQNLRQVFTAEDPNGRLIVGDFAAVESRGLAYLAGANWKLHAYRTGQDMYKVQAAAIYGTPYDQITKEQRRTGKVGELSCGYGAGGKAVQSFAEKMGVIFTEDEAAQLVIDWREANPQVTALWHRLDQILHEVVEHGYPYAETHVGPGGDLTIRLEHHFTPWSIRNQRADAQTIRMRLLTKTRTTVLKRWFQGCFMDGRDVCYMKPSELKNGKPWQEHWTKKNQSGRYKLYGGKLAGILTQSFCRELFFASSRYLYAELQEVANAWLVGQFHDELVVEWIPENSPLVQKRAGKTITLGATTRLVAETMNQNKTFPDFPLTADVHSAHRYIK